MPAFFAKIIAFFMAILALFGIKTGNKPVAEVIFQNDTVTVKAVENQLDVSMTSNPSTGYNWTYDMKGDSVNFVSSSWESIDRGDFPLAGAPGTSHFIFEVAKPGITTVHFIYSRIFEAGSTIDEFTMFITVGSDMTVSITAA